MKPAAHTAVRRAGPRRVVAHIILFFLLGALALAAGVAGRHELAGKTARMESALRVDALLEGGISAVRAALVGEEMPSALARQIDTGLSSKKRGLKETITGQVAQGLSDEQIALTTIDTLIGGALGRVKNEEALVGLRQGRLEVAACGAGLGLEVL